MSSQPVVVPVSGRPLSRGPSPASLVSYSSSPGTSLPPFSPPVPFAYPSPLGVAGASPPYRGGSSLAGDKANPYAAAKKFWKRICFDPALDPTEYSIGFIETVQQPERKSGVEAWSMRLHDRLQELPYALFVARFCGAGAFGDGGPPPQLPAASPGGWAVPQSTSEEAGSDVPYHRIAYFKHGATVVWESEYHKRRLSDLPVAPAAAAMGGGGSSEGGAASATPTAAATRRRTSRDGIPPIPPASPSLAAAFGAHPASLPRPGPGFAVTGVLAPHHAPGSASGASGRSPKGASPRGSDDDAVGGSSDDDDDILLQLDDEEEPDDDEEGAACSEEEDEERAAAGSLGRMPGSRAVRGGSAGSSAGGRGAGELPPPPLPQLPEEVWMAMLQQLGVRDVCMVGRTCRWLRGLAADPVVWRSQHEALWGCPPEAQLGPAVVRRMCRRSQLRAARWLEAAVRGGAMGFASTTCLQMDDSKVVSGDGNAVRLWSHATGRRIATLQGHPGRVTCVAFDEDLLVSGCAGSTVKLWSMDELRCRRTLRGHDGAVTSCCLLPTGIPVSGSEDGVMRLWDVASGSSILALEAGNPVLALQAHAPSGHLVAAAGWGLQLWDVGTATLLNTLGAGLDGDDAALAAAAAAGGAAAGGASQHPYTCVSYMGELLAAGRQGEVVLLDPRVNSAVGRLRCGAASGGGSGGYGACGNGSAAGVMGLMGGGANGAFANGMGSIAAAAAGGAVGGKNAQCVGVQMDEWKLVCGFNDGRHRLSVFDIRALPRGGQGASGGGGGRSGARRPWHEPLLTLTAPARINAFQYHEQALLAGLEGHDCVMWRFENPNTAATAVGPLAAAAGAGAPGYCGSARASGQGLSNGGAVGGAAAGDGGPADAAAGTGRKEKKKPAKVAKKQTRYPKRNTK